MIKAIYSMHTKAFIFHGGINVFTFLDGCSEERKRKKVDDDRPIDERYVKMKDDYFGLLHLY